eukprot:7842884-Prorocentrum_lima.AAC.1
MNQYHPDTVGIRAHTAPLAHNISWLCAGLEGHGTQSSRRSMEPPNAGRGCRTHLGPGNPHPPEQ